MKSVEELIERGSTLSFLTIDKQDISDWVFEVEDYLKENNQLSSDSKIWIANVKRYGFQFSDGNNLISYLKTLGHSIKIPEITERNKIFVAMWFNEKMEEYYLNGYKVVSHENNYSCSRIDEKQYDGSIIEQIKTEISNSAILIADLTGNRGGVYYEAGIAKGLSMCGHPIRLILTCRSDYFHSDNKPHFDVSGDNIIIYSDVDDLKSKLDIRIREGGC